ncbi:autophagy protein 13 [Pyricularia oryzae]
MHQQSRYPPRSSSPANSPQTNPTRTNNSRDAPGTSSRSRASSSAAGPDISGAEMGDPGSGPSRDSVKKLDQIVQNFYNKAAVLIIQARLNTTPIVAAASGRGTSKTNKWFQIETDEMDDFREDLRIWRTCGSFENRPPPMIIETYLDASCLSPTQSLVVVGDNGKMYDVLEALNSSDSASDGSSSSRSRKRNTEVVLERWKIELKYSQNPDDIPDFGPMLPTIYKRAIVFFRSLFSMLRLVATWKVLQKQPSIARGGHSALQLHCRFVFKESDTAGVDLLRQPLSPQHDGRDAVSDYVFGDLEVPVGRFYASVTSRNERNFRVDDTDVTAGSRFMTYEDNLFQPTLPQRHSGRRDSFTETGIAIPRRHGKQVDQPEQQTYGSLSTFHGAGALGTSPLSALKAVRPAGSDTDSPTSSAPASVGPDPPHSLPIAGQSSLNRPSLRGTDGIARRTSVSFQPFKAGSLSGSPRLQDLDLPASPSSLARQSAALHAARQRNSLTSGMAASLRGGPPIDIAGSASPKPASRYSSSFTHRKGKPSYSGANRGDDDQGSSGKQSLSSSVQPGSGFLAEAATGTSSGSVQTDDENISEFLKILDSKRTLQSFEPTSKTTEAATKRTVAQLSKFHMMRESNNALTESMTSSINLQPSPSASSRQLSGVPLLGPSSMSPSSSPKPLSPHTPHTPAVPSRLSEAAIIEHHTQAHEIADRVAAQDDHDLGVEASTTRREGTTAIDIPLSPRVLQTANRRSSSVAHQNRALLDNEEPVPDLPFAGNRSISLGADGREPTRLTGLGLSRGSRSSGNSASLRSADVRPAGAPRSSSMSTDPDDKNPSPALISGGASSGSSWKPRFTGSLGRGQQQQPPQQRLTPPHSSRGSFSGSNAGGRYGGSGSRGAGDSAEADDEPFMFTMSEIERHGQGRTSLDEARPGGEGSGAIESGEKIRGGRYEARGITRRGW